MAKFDSFFDKYILPKFSYTQVAINDEDTKGINRLDEVISNFHESHKYLKDKYNTFQKSQINFNHLKSKNTPIADSIIGKKDFKYAFLLKEVEDLIDEPILSKKQWDEANDKFQNSIQAVPVYIDKISLFKYIYQSLKIYIRRKQKTNYSFNNFSGLNQYISNKSLAMKFKIQLYDKKQFDSQIKQIQSEIKELTQVKSEVSKLLSLDQNLEEAQAFTDTTKYLINIFGLTTIYHIKLNDKLELLIIIDNKSYRIADIISEFKKIEEQITHILNQAEKIKLLINSCFKDKGFVATYKKMFSSKKGCFITTLGRVTNKYFKNIDCKLSLESPSRLHSTINAVKDNANFKYLQFIYEQIDIFLKHNNENKNLDINQIITLIQIVSLSMEGIGLNGSGEYVLYSNYNNSNFITLKEAIKQLSQVKGKIKVYISKIKHILAIGQRCLEFPQLFITLKQSYLTNPENVKSYLSEYEAKLEQTKVDLESSITEVEEKILSVKSIYSELTEIEEHVEYVFDLVYKNGITKTIAKNKSKLLENIPEIFQSVHELILIRNRRKTELFFVYSDTKKAYLILRREYLKFQNSLCTLKREAEIIKNNNEYCLKQKKTQIFQQKKRSLEIRYFKSLCIKFFVISVFIWLFSWGFILYKSNSDENENSEVITSYYYPQK